jgi:endonuclease/exonuclease/phosphatase (EEP) superfamily protein YafD
MDGLHHPSHPAPRASAWLAEPVSPSPDQPSHRPPAALGRGAAALGRTLAWVLVLLALLATASRWLDVPSSPLVLVQSVSWMAAPVALLAVAGVVVSRRRGSRVALAGACVLVLGVHAWIWAPWLTQQDPRPGDDLTVMAANVYRGRADTAAISTLVRREGVDVLTLSEVKESTLVKLDTAGITRRLPYAYPDGVPPEGSLILSRVPLIGLGSANGPVVGETAQRNPAARLRDGSRVVVRAIHPMPPVPARIRNWRASLDDLSDWVAQASGPLVLAGDFNASLDHPGMRELLAAGVRDAHEAAGAGRPPTWPNGRLVPPFVQIDHVLVRGLDVKSAEDVRIPGSDHDAVVAHLVLPAES